MDLDGTLIRGDASWESTKGMLLRSPWSAWLLPVFFFDRARFKHEVAKRFVPDVARFRYVPAVVAYAKEQRAAGRTVVLATASNVAIAEAVAAHLGCFDGVIASDATHFRGGVRKADALMERFGPKGFVYAGNEIHDFPVWEAAAAAVLCNVPGPVAAAAKKRFAIERVFP